jgi:hypothetical protein
MPSGASYGGIGGSGSDSGDGHADCTGAMRIGDVTFYWYGAMLTTFTFVVGFVSSFLFDAPSDEGLAELTVWTTTAADATTKQEAMGEEEGEPLVQPLLLN